MRRRQIWAARAAADLAAGNYTAIAPETPIAAIGVFAPVTPPIEPPQTPEAMMAVLNEWKTDALQAPKRRGRPPKVKRDG